MSTSFLLEISQKSVENTESLERQHEVAHRELRRRSVNGIFEYNGERYRGDYRKPREENGKFDKSRNRGVQPEKYKRNRAQAQRDCRAQDYRYEFPFIVGVVPFLSHYVA